MSYNPQHQVTASDNNYVYIRETARRLNMTEAELTNGMLDFCRIYNYHQFERYLNRACEIRDQQNGEAATA